VCDPAQADSVTECGSTWPKMAFVSHPLLVTATVAPPSPPDQGVSAQLQSWIQGATASRVFVHCKSFVCVVQP